MLFSEGLFVENSLRADVNLNSSTGWESGGTLSVNADTAKFDYTAGSGYIVTGLNPVVRTKVTWDAATAVTVDNLATHSATFLFIDLNGDIYQSVTFPEGSDIRDKVYLGALVHANSTSISGASNSTNAPIQNIAASLTDLSIAMGVINVNGNVFAGDPAGNLKFTKSVGRTFFYGHTNKTSPDDPNHIDNPLLTAPNVLFGWRDGVGGFATSFVDAVVAGVFDDDTGGASNPIDTLTTNQWTNHRIYYSPDANQTVIEYGQTKYNSDTTALVGQSTETFVSNPTFSAVPFRGFCTMRGGATDLSLVADAIFTNANKFGIV